MCQVDNWGNYDTDKVSFYGSWFLSWSWKREVLKSKEEEGEQWKSLFQRLREEFWDSISFCIFTWCGPNSSLVSHVWSPYTSTNDFFSVVKSVLNSLWFLFCKCLLPALNLPYRICNRPSWNDDQVLFITSVQICRAVFSRTACEDMEGKILVKQWGQCWLK